MSATTGFAENTPGTVLLRLGSYRLTLQQFDFAVIALWFVVTAAAFRYDELLLYPMALYFTFAFFRDRHATWPVFKFGFVLLLVPVWWILSTLWTPEPALAAKSGLQVLLTMLICMFMASRMTLHQLMVILLIALSITAFRCLQQALLDLARGWPSRGIYTHKNSLGADMSILVVVALSMILTPQVSRQLRIAAICMVPLGLLLVFASQSATAILTTVGMTGILFGAYIYLGHHNSISEHRLTLIAFTLALVAMGLAAVMSLFPFDPIDLVLNSVGKDRGLTGRTDLWSMAMSEIEERPLLGTGAYGFWRYEESPFVRQVFIDYFKVAGNKFHFHNSWLELSVNLGLIGGGLALLTTGWAVWVLITRVFGTGGAQSWALLAIGCTILARTMTEADLFVQFVRLHMVLWTGVLIVGVHGVLSRRSPTQTQRAL